MPGACEVGVHGLYTDTMSARSYRILYIPPPSQDLYPKATRNRDYPEARGSATYPSDFQVLQLKALAPKLWPCPMGGIRGAHSHYGWHR